MTKSNNSPVLHVFITLIAFCFASFPAYAEMVDYPVVKLQSLDKATARTMTFEAKVGTTVKFGPLYIKVQACRKASPLDQPESASFLQIWEVTKQDKAQWVFSGWMYASSPALSPMDHPIYDVWVIDCLEGENGAQTSKQDSGADGEETPDSDAENDVEAEVETEDKDATAEDESAGNDSESE